MREAKFECQDLLLDMRQMVNDLPEHRIPEVKRLLEQVKRELLTIGTTAHQRVALG